MTHCEVVIHIPFHDVLLPFTEKESFDETYPKCILAIGGHQSRLWIGKDDLCLILKVRWVILVWQNTGLFFLAIAS